MNPLTVLDVTLRDGGYVTNHVFTQEAAEDIAASCTRAGVDVVEIGYFRRRALPAPEAVAAYCPDGYVRRLAALKGASRIAVMVHADHCAPAEMAALPDLGVDLVRLPLRPDRYAAALGHVERARRLGLDVSVNLIRVSEVSPDVLAQAARDAAEAGAQVLYLADSNGSLYPDRVGEMMRATAAASGLPLGFHAHDGLSLAFSNTLAAVEAGAEWIDASIGGIGKGSGNCATETIAVHLERSTGRRFDHVALAEVGERRLGRWIHTRFAEICAHRLASALDLNVEQVTALKGSGPLGLLRALQDRMEPDPAGTRPALNDRRH